MEREIEQLQEECKVVVHDKSETKEASYINHSVCSSFFEEKKRPSSHSIFKPVHLISNLTFKIM